MTEIALSSHHCGAPPEDPIAQARRNARAEAKPRGITQYASPFFFRNRHGLGLPVLGLRLCALACRRRGGKMARSRGQVPPPRSARDASGMCGSEVATGVAGATAGRAEENLKTEIVEISN